MRPEEVDEMIGEFHAPPTFDIPGEHESQPDDMDWLHRYREFPGPSTERDAWDELVARAARKPAFITFQPHAEIDQISRESAIHSKMADPTSDAEATHASSEVHTDLETTDVPTTEYDGAQNDEAPDEGSETE